uniref:Uncharacterized protein n=1 Tax=Chromera velia CCMP2878 TaxID=1169474 RepID=A0A0G4GRR0_9ALVE|eukprot:Cvel_5110.t1-p1 / transcript=Cvel_5110.t1 / gene=Cvel_5110 / organism=Chromera_velia_CCMP2878 / gene_product=hypothetical protein / transcript_product=hypothetical protein / location=Cvel_scaffold233:99851-102444(-) / protein_length=656 / sequence_SO=supercontig / SO=protein_coding / is_pseudo=false
MNEETPKKLSPTSSSSPSSSFIWDILFGPPEPHPKPPSFLWKRSSKKPEGKEADGGVDADQNGGQSKKDGPPCTVAVAESEGGHPECDFDLVELGLDGDGEGVAGGRGSEEGEEKKKDGDQNEMGEEEEGEGDFPSPLTSVPWYDLSRRLRHRHRPTIGAWTFFPDSEFGQSQIREVSILIVGCPENGKKALLRSVFPPCKVLPPLPRNTVRPLFASEMRLLGCVHTHVTRVARRRRSRGQGGGKGGGSGVRGGGSDGGNGFRGDSSDSGFFSDSGNSSCSGSSERRRSTRAPSDSIRRRFSLSPGAAHHRGSPVSPEGGRSPSRSLSPAGSGARGGRAEEKEAPESEASRPSREETRREFYSVTLLLHPNAHLSGPEGVFGKPSFFESAALLLCFDVCDRESFERARRFLTDVCVPAMAALSREGEEKHKRAERKRAAVSGGLSRLQQQQQNLTIQPQQQRQAEEVSSPLSPSPPSLFPPPVQTDGFGVFRIDEALEAADASASSLMPPPVSGGEETEKEKEKESLLKERAPLESAAIVLVGIVPPRGSSFSSAASSASVRTGRRGGGGGSSGSGGGEVSGSSGSGSGRRREVSFAESFLLAASLGIDFVEVGGDGEDATEAAKVLLSLSVERGVVKTRWDFRVFRGRNARVLPF